jgi:membrane protease subunit (stomatin/prohibitin family)
VLSKKWSELRGIEIVSFGVSSVKASEEDEQMIKELQRNAAFRNPTMAAAHLVGAQAEAMKAAAANEGNMGAAMGFMGMNMANNAGGMNPGNLYAMGQAQAQQMQQQATPQPQADGWKCACGAVNTGKFCGECGSAKPAPQNAGGWTCACGAVNKGKFCGECGAKKPANAPLYKCDKCGWEPADPANPPRFCPECGDIFNDADKQ